MTRGRILREEKVATTGGIGQQARGVQMRIPDAADRAKVIPKLKALAQGYTNQLGAGSPPLEVDDDGDGLVRVVVTDTGLTEKVRRAVDQSIEVIRRRIDALGTREPSIQRQGDDRIIVEVPGLQDPEQLKTILGQTAKLEFRLVAEPGQSPAETEELEQTDQSGKMSIEKQVMVQGEDLDRRAARLRSAHRRARRQFPLQYSRRRKNSARSRRECRAAVRHRARQQGDLRAAHPDADHRRLRPDLRPFHGRTGQ